MTETRVRWEPRVGRLNRAYENVAAPALDDHRALMARLGNLNLSSAPITAQRRWQALSCVFPR